MTQKIAYSAREQQILGLLKARPQESTTLCQLLYYPDEPPFYGQQATISLLATVARKAAHNNEAFRICKSERAGPRPMSFWKEKA